MPLAASPMPADHELIATLREAVAAVEALFVDARRAVAERVMKEGRAASRLFDREQRATHGLAWLATYVEALRQLADYAQRLSADGGFGELEELLVRIGAGEYLAQIFGGIPMSQGEIARLADLGLSPGAAAAWATPGVEHLIAFGNTALRRARLLELIRSHPQATVGAFFAELGERAKQLEAVSMDMCAPYILETKTRAPQAEIAFDPFHVVKLASEAVHDVRRTEARERKGTAEAAVLKGSRWALLKAPENLRDEERVHLSAVAGLNARVFRAYLLKEELRALYRCGPRSAPEHLCSWLSWASRSNLAPFVKLGRTLRQYRDGILAAIRLRLSNGRMEGLNNKIGVIKHRAYGFHSFAALAAMVFLCCTDLHLELPI